MLITSDPVNIHHILSRSFSNYPKGVEFREIFDLLGNGIFNVDSELWEIHRKTTVSLMSHAMFQILLERSTWDTIENGLQPFLDAFVEQGSPLNLQDIFQRFTFDTISKIGLPYVPCEKAFNVFVDAVKNTSPTNWLSVEQVSKRGSQK
ncbi:Alkane hydroxylase MAH1 [Capsicum chinense]|nr:Alkane hydroxylase MAH1 [Capsicum chinense]